MRYTLLLAGLLGLFSCSKPLWAPVSGHIQTPWTDQVSARNPWPEYPRPHLVRKKWQNLNGLWDYAIRPVNEGMPSAWDGQILVPYPVESSLSGVKKQVDSEHKLWYKRSFNLPSSWESSDVLIHFEAVDWDCTLWVNGREAGQHRGGYDPFSFSVGQYLRPGNNELVLSVYDPTDKGWQPVGKQTLTPGGIFYTSVTGIWQSVWIEPVSASYINDYQAVSDIDSGTVTITCDVAGAVACEGIEVEVIDGNQLVANGSAKPADAVTLVIPNPVLWEPGQGHLYRLRIKLLQQGATTDEVSGYFGMRKVSLGKDDKGLTRILINNRFVFQNGPLDQGFWPDGIYTPPTEDAMKYDLEMIRKMGFNMLRKHVKVEPRRFYYWCDRMGLLVWQDMPNGDAKIAPEDPDITRTQESASQFERELTQLVKTHINHPSIIMWVPFNEGWGQYETPRIVNYVKSLDKTRLVNNASGWSDRQTGDVLDWHSYPAPSCPPAEEKRAVVLGEFGGLGLKTEGHMWENSNWGYSSYSTPNALLADYERYYAEVWGPFRNKGLSASIYTQITDVETEANGLLTYDRRVSKIDPAVLHDINTGTFTPAPVIDPPGGMINAGDTVRIKGTPNAIVTVSYGGNTFQRVTQVKPYRSGRVTAIATENGRTSRIAAADFIVTTQKKPVYSRGYHPKYRGGGIFGLCDGLTGSEQFSDGHWQGFSGDDLETTFELPETANIREVRAGFLENTGVWIFPPRKLTVLTSEDGIQFEKAGEWTPPAPPAENRPARIERASVSFSERPARYVRVRAENTGVCPDWHPGKGQRCWLFADEISWQ
jgi:hypothetical protein